MFNAFFPRVTLECEEHILAPLGHGRELKEVTRHNDLLAVSKCEIDSAHYMINVPESPRMACLSFCVVLLPGQPGG